MELTTKRRANGILVEVGSDLSGEALAEIRQRMAEARRSSERVSVDLSRVELMDREAVLFFAIGEGRTIEIVACPRHLREWIRAEARQRGVRHGMRLREFRFSGSHVGAYGIRTIRRRAP